MYNDSHGTIESEAYRNVITFSKEYVVTIGKIGYYYGTRVWIDHSGTIYCIQNYEEHVLTFDSIVQLIDYKLLKRNLDSIAMKP